MPNDASETTGSAHGVLVAARKLIEREEDWGGCNSKGSNCAQTAISAVAGFNPDEPALDAFRAAVGITDKHTPAIWDWNDHPDRTHAEVLAAFDKAIAATGAA